MDSKSLLPPEQNTLPKEETKPSRGLASPQVNLEHGKQLSSFTELKQGKKTGTLFAVVDSPLKSD